MASLDAERWLSARGLGDGDDGTAGGRDEL